MDSASGCGGRVRLRGQSVHAGGSTPREGRVNRTSQVGRVLRSHRPGWGCIGASASRVGSGRVGGSARVGSRRTRRVRGDTGVWRSGRCWGSVGVCGAGRSTRRCCVWCPGWDPTSR
ncbi:hypothetical protein B005_4552 [Nocardiopsis alba ATCC BAA-2165]|uniref:Uncharacterized protein n=1 Tax=Nocardiopsis alba (strain ATCC BAA-2165 / BE74) TaxID=1205910 RepID=J7LAJ5_NOCAA|nr:hypothetical protein B005_4552 [Nocardiopsis alba ATCC BAA-2165]